MKVNPGKMKVMVSGDTSNDGLSISNLIHMEYVH